MSKDQIPPGWRATEYTREDGAIVCSVGTVPLADALAIHDAAIQIGWDKAIEAAAMTAIGYGTSTPDPVEKAMTSSMAAAIRQLRRPA